ncbi:ParB/Srx family N-terminal domain-containing protein [Methyloceanibacter stevinii]|nr:ParB/Srx family N-terminal domain-containing protein [Methyloceanibacter stevinii]
MPTIQSVPLSTFKPNPRNARTHSKKQIREIADSIAAFGFVMPILTDDNGMIIAGHGRLEAAKILGLRRRRQSFWTV